MKRLLFFCFLLLTFAACDATLPIKKEVRILVLSKTAGFRHASIETGKTALIKLGLANQFKVDTTENAAAFTDANLKKYAAVVFLSTTGDVLNNAQQLAFEKYIKKGGGFVGVHAATDTEYDWPWYGKLAGAYFTSHPAVQEARFIVKDTNHPSTQFITDSVWIHKDELYNFKDINPDIKVLITIDEKSYKGGKNGDYHPFSWYHDYDGGRAFYTSMGHTKECWAEDKFLQHLLGGINYATGKKTSK